MFNYFPFPWTVSAIHVVVGALYCGITYLFGFKEASFGRVRPSSHVLARLRRLAWLAGARTSDACAFQKHAELLRVWQHTELQAATGVSVNACRVQGLTKKEFTQIFWPASMHAIGHVAANLSFAAVAISLTHTVKTLEPAFNVVLSRALLGNATPAPVVATLVPIMVRLRSLPPCLFPL